MIQDTNSLQQDRSLLSLVSGFIAIGLVVGAVVISEDMQRSSGVRKSIAQLTDMQQAVSEFIGFYGTLPGDLTPNAIAYYFYDKGFVNRSGKIGHGDGNGMIESGTHGELYAKGELLLAWRDLATAGMIPGPFLGNDYTQAIYDTTHFFPPAYLGDDVSLVLFSVDKKHYLEIAEIRGSNSQGQFKLNLGVKPVDLYKLDTKIDDGNPYLGRVQARASHTEINGKDLLEGVDKCIRTDSNQSAYNTSLAKPICQGIYEIKVTKTVYESINY